MAEPGPHGFGTGRGSSSATDSIRQKYAREMGMVANRLPLRLGDDPAPQHTPLRILLEAAGVCWTVIGWVPRIGKLANLTIGMVCLWRKKSPSCMASSLRPKEDSKVLDPWRPYMTTDSPPTESQRHLDRRYYYCARFAERLCENRLCSCWRKLCRRLSGIHSIHVRFCLAGQLGGSFPRSPTTRAAFAWAWRSAPTSSTS